MRFMRSTLLIPSFPERNCCRDKGGAPWSLGTGFVIPGNDDLHKKSLVVNDEIGRVCLYFNKVRLENWETTSVSWKWFCPRMDKTTLFDGYFWLGGTLSTLSIPIFKQESATNSFQHLLCWMCLSRFSKQRHPISPEKVRELVEYLFSETSKNNRSLMIATRCEPWPETKQVGHHWCPSNEHVFSSMWSFLFFQHFISVCACSKPALRRPFILLENIWERDSLWIVIIPNVLLRIIR